MVARALQCPCGKTSIYIDASCSMLRIQCGICRRMLIDYTEDKQSRSLTVKNQCDVPTQHHAAGYNKKIHGYTLLKGLGSGTAGTVYLAMHDKTQEQVALKLLRQEENVQNLDYFLREAQILFQLDHPNIVRLKDRGNYQGKPYFVMEYIPGTHLRNIIDRETIHYFHAAKIIRYVLRALEHAARYNIIHRDIKPDNIFVGVGGEIKLIDLGIGKILGETHNLTNTGQAMGTPYYMPPEQAADAKRADYRSDIYAVGATLYHLLCGMPPFSEFKDLEKLFYAKTHDRYMRLPERKPDLPPGIVQITTKAMAAEPKKRYANAREMLVAITDFCKRHVKK